MLDHPPGAFTSSQNSLYSSRHNEFTKRPLPKGPRLKKTAKKLPREQNIMNVAQPVPISRHPYADGSYKKMLIDGKWVDAASGKRFETHNPATGELLATVAEGDAED